MYVFLLVCSKRLPSRKCLVTNIYTDKRMREGERFEHFYERVIKVKGEKSPKKGLFLFDYFIPLC